MRKDKVEAHLAQPRGTLGKVFGILATHANKANAIERFSEKENMKYLFCVLATFLILDCSSSDSAYRFSNLRTVTGKPNAFQTTSNWGANLFIVGPVLINRASLDNVVKDFTTYAKTDGATKVEFVGYTCTNYWYVGGPFSIFITPINCELSGVTYKEEY